MRDQRLRINQTAPANKHHICIQFTRQGRELQGNGAMNLVSAKFADGESILFCASVFVVLSSVLDEQGKPLHPVLVDRNKFILPGVTGNFSDRRN
jgi:hypothetical protein